MELTVKKVGLIRFAFICVKGNLFKEFLRVFARTLIERTKSDIFAANDGGAVCGFCVSRPLPKKYDFPDSKAIIIGPLHVFPKHRRKGAGKALVRAACENPEKPAYAYVLKQNADSIATFSSVGFSKKGYMTEHNKKYSISDNKSKFVVMYRDLK